ncbi:transcriptional regulator, LysR family [Malonomonas rubra DSM 5091]|uniref:Transcriptional regulator, LysR family n=1 Tax=Malonomonas rubra DSM 5091 TaxID=1122189 RepID=A0A1M6JI89_MALRU|nr:selenium metabolism-associated LysR family transcriptional regulator [Malonomonas rubra]SHJ46404.1 transcriptional regulator, LysR family [Malonomonas rubra DSM 5091]
MNLRQLDLFVAVAETGSFSRGAEIICLTQSTVSQHIAALEDEVDTRLFDRTQQGALLTPGGEVFLRHARRILAERDQLYQGMANFNGLSEGDLLIGASNIPANHLIPEILPRLAQTYPGVSLNMQSGDSQTVLQSLLSAEVELAVVGGRSDNKKLEFLPLGSDVLVLIVGRKHPWYGKGMISLNDLTQQPMVVREKSSGSEQALLRELQRINFDTGQLQIAARLGSNEGVRQVVLSGFGCAFVSELSVRHELEAGDLWQVSVGGMRVERKFWLASLRGRSLSPAAIALSRLLQEAYPAAKN